MTKDAKGHSAKNPVGETRAQVAKMLETFKEPVDIANALGISRQAVHHHIKKLRFQNEQAIVRGLPEHRVPAVERIPEPKKKNRTRNGETRAKVANLLLVSKDRKDIAKALGISRSTVDDHIQAIRLADERLLQRKMIDARIMILPSELP